MLNWIWLGLIVIALAVATGRDVSELSSDRFRNDKPIPLSIVSAQSIDRKQNTVDAFIPLSTLRSFYETGDAASVKTDSVRVLLEYKSSGACTFALPSDAPLVWKDMAAAQGDEKILTGNVRIDGEKVMFVADPVRYRILAKVANEGLLKMADVAVTIALGLIGVMALWLGIMKIAEAAGLVTLLAKMAKPLMIRLFPDVPPEHPAMGAMLSNMADRKSVV